MRKIILFFFVLMLLIGCSNVKEEVINPNCSKCTEYQNKDCNSDTECGGFPCVNDKCLVKVCSSDNDCPNKLCGLHLTPTPGYCTTTDVI